MFTRFLKWLGSIFKKTPREEDNSPEHKSIQPIVKIAFKNTFTLNNNFNAQRSLFLWGTDSQNNPSFAVLFSHHYIYGRPVFSSYAVFRGAGGHFPSFDHVKIVEARDPKTKERHNVMLYARDASPYGYYAYSKALENKAYKDFHILESNRMIPFNYDKRMSYAEMLKKLNLSQLRFIDFTLSTNPMDVMDLPAECIPYAEAFFGLFSCANIYMRKKILKELISSNPPKSVYEYILKVGSSELISGLFLELCMRNDPIIAVEASRLKANDLQWLPVSYQKGVLRCAALYTDSFSEEKRAERINYIYENIFKSQQQDIIGLKDALQTAVAYRHADILGKVAYCLDMGKFHFNTHTKTRTYFRRYLRRVIDGYAGTDEVKFFEVMKSFLTGFTEEDGQYQLPYLLRHYLYWSKRHQDSRLEFKPDMWDRHIEDALDIASSAEAETVAEPLYKILADNKPRLEGLSFDTLIKAAGAPYAPIADLMAEIIYGKFQADTAFNPDLMLTLARSENPALQRLADKYRESFGGTISAGILVHFLFMHDLENRVKFVEDAINKFSVSEYAEFLTYVYDNAKLFVEQHVIWPESFAEMMDRSLNKLDGVPEGQKTALTNQILNALSNGGLPDYLAGFGEKIIFSLNDDELRSLLAEYNIPDVSEAKSARVFKLLSSIKDNAAPDDNSITDILDNGSPAAINALVRLLSRLDGQLKTRLRTLLLLMESKVASLNESAKNIFMALPDTEKTKLHAMILDSPDKKTYQFGMDKLGEFYENKPIPAEYIKEMLQHPSYEVRSFVSDKVNSVINNLGAGDKELFIYYAKTLLLLPNKVSKGKKNIYSLLPRFVGVYGDKRPEIETLLLNIGGSNIISDSERALVALAEIKGRDAV